MSASCASKCYLLVYVYFYLFIHLGKYKVLILTTISHPSNSPLVYQTYENISTALTLLNGLHAVMILIFQLQEKLL